ncbi:MAG TPA: exosortase/archaeosortase family protein [Myxococcota bacterium]|nr:exosortase/archaeosortase family protein [Myxococcota bacterium]
MRRWLWVAPFTLAFAPTGAWLVGRWTESIFRNGHGIFVPFLMAYLALDQLKQDRDPEPRASAAGFAFLGASFVLLALDAAIKTQLLSAFALVLALPGLSLLLLGGDRTRAIALPLAIGLFMLPIPAGAISKLYLVLRQMTAVVVTVLVPLFGVAISRDGTQLSIPGHRVDVADNCSGFATLYAAILTAVILAHLSRSPRRRAAVLLAAIPLALVCNFLRVTALVLLVYVFGDQILETEVHPGSGLVLFVLVIGVLVWLAGRDALRASTGNARPPLSDRYAAALFGLSALALLPVLVHSYLRFHPDDCAHPEVLVPQQIAGTFSPDREAELRRNFDLHQWREGRVAGVNGGPELQFAVIRSFDPKELYYRGTRRIWKDVEPGADRLDWIEADGERLPVVRSTVSGEGRREQAVAIGSLLVYEGAPVANGWLAQLRAAPRQALFGSRPMTLFAVRSDVPPSQLDAARKRVDEWLVRSWSDYRAICAK